MTRRTTASGIDTATLTIRPEMGMDQLDIIVIGASAGGLEALLDIVSGLPARLPAAILIAVHTGSEGTGQLPKILARVSRLPVAFARTGDKLTSGQIYVAPADVHLLIT